MKLEAWGECREGRRLELRVQMWVSGSGFQPGAEVFQGMLESIALSITSMLRSTATAVSLKPDSKGLICNRLNQVWHVMWPSQSMKRKPRRQERSRP